MSGEICLLYKMETDQLPIFWGQYYDEWDAKFEARFWPLGTVGFIVKGLLCEGEGQILGDYLGRDR